MPSGRKKTPRKLLSDSKHAKYERRDEYEPEPESIPMPDSLTPAAQECWEKVVTELDSKGILCRLDGPTLHRYCELWAAWAAATKSVDESGLTYSTEKGVVANPEVKMMREFHESLLKIEVQFGMTPASRPNIPKPKDKNESDDFVAQMLKATRMN